MKTLLFLLIVALALGAAIYWFRQSPRSFPLRLSPPAVTSTASSSSSPSTVSLPMTDATWQTYRNKMLNFSFQYPTKGKLAPSFTVKLLPLTSQELENRCYRLGNPSAPAEKKTVAGTEFCRSFTSSKVDGLTVDQEYWVAAYDKWYVLITFSKKYANPSTFDLPSYRLYVEQILSTFMNATSSSR